MSKANQVLAGLFLKKQKYALKSLMLYIKNVEDSGGDLQNPCQILKHLR